MGDGGVDGGQDAARFPVCRALGAAGRWATAQVFTVPASTASPGQPFIAAAREKETLARHAPYLVAPRASSQTNFHFLLAFVHVFNLFISGANTCRLVISARGKGCCRARGAGSARLTTGVAGAGSEGHLASHHLTPARQGTGILASSELLTNCLCPPVDTSLL